MLTRFFKTETHLRLFRLGVEAKHALFYDDDRNTADKAIAWLILIGLTPLCLLGIGTRRTAFPHLFKD